MKVAWNRRRWFCFAALAYLTLAMGTLEARAEKKVVSAPLTDPADLTHARTLLQSSVGRDDPHLRAHIYNPERPPVHTFEDYVRVYIRIGRGDLNDDGTEELFYFDTNGGYSGSAGAPILIFERRGDAWNFICATSGGQDITITDWVSEGGYREFISRAVVYWRNGKCYEDEPRTPETQDYPPRSERTWKPIR